MGKGIPLFPEQASSSAPQVDALYLYMVGLSLVGSVLIASLLLLLAYRYRKRAAVDRSNPRSNVLSLEVTWTVIPAILYIIAFGWGARIFFNLSRPPDDAMEIFVVGKRWMWKLQHLNGLREINELHVPAGYPVKLTMTSEDVIHSFYVPAFRVKADVLPGRYTMLWFKATKPGRYHLFCAEYCGTKHSQMTGSVVVMEPSEFQAWLTGEGEGISLAEAGEKLFTSLGCVTCHNPTSRARGPDLAGKFGTPVVLESGETVMIDEAYVREAIVDPKARVVKGYAAVMPTFRGLVGEEGLLKLIEYIRSIGPREVQPAAPPPAAPAGAGAARGAS